MVKALSVLLLCLVICAMSVGFLVFNQSWNVIAAESARQSRIKLQYAEQNIGLLKQARKERTLTSLSRDQDSLKVHLALKLNDLSAKNTAMRLSFEQRQVSAFRAHGHDIDISVLSLKVGFLANHAPSAQGILAGIGEAIGIWPYEFRACEMIRSKDKMLSVNCMLHIYHWPASTSVLRS